MKRISLAAVCAVAVTLAAICPAFAEEDRFSLHGYGNQDYWKSTSNSFDGSGGHGSVDNNFLGLVMSATINDKSKVWAQLQTSSTNSTTFTWFFVDYQITEQLRAHAGRVRFPYGIYNDIIDTKALQLSAALPLAYAQEADMVYNAYNGIGLDYDVDLGHSGHLLLQGFGGNVYEAGIGGSPDFPDQVQLGDLKAEAANRRLFGGKITWDTPVDGLRAMVSGNQTMVETSAVNGQVPNQRGMENRLILSLDYTNAQLDLKSEYNLHRFPGLSGRQDLKSRAWYVQAGYLFGAWTPYARYDSMMTDESASGDPSYYQRDFVVGLNRKLRTNLNVRAEEHFNHGYALPVAAGETQTGKGKPSWQLFVVSVNFLF
jgi:hypothetical protein